MKMILAISLAGLFIFSNGCKKEDALKGIDKAALFATPTAAEISSVQEIWQHRNLTPTDIVIERSQKIKDDLSLHIISFKLNGIKEYMAALVPSSTKPLPVLFHLGGFGTEQDPVNSVGFKLPNQNENPPYIFVVPSMRGQYVSLTVNDIKISSPVSEGNRFDAFDGATDDVIAGLNAIDVLFEQADPSRAMIRGGSRGGTVALLAGERDTRFKRVAPIAFNVEFISLTSQLYNDPIYKGQFLEGLIKGTASIAETRRLMIASSPLYFCDRLPKTQLHCAEKDRITPAAQGEMLYNAMKNSGMQDKVELFIYPGRDHDNIGNENTELNTRINNFFAELFN